MIHIKKLFLLGVTIAASSTALLGMPGLPIQPGNPSMPNIYGGPSDSMGANAMAGPSMSEEDELMQAEVKKMVQDVNDYRASLPPADQEKFDREAQETANRIQTRMDEMLKNDPTLEERFKNQDPEALDMFFQSVFGPEIERAMQEEQAEPGPSVSEPTVPGPSIQPEKPEKKPAKEEIKKKIDVKAVLEMIESIIEYLESFKEKSTVIITLQGLYEKWAKDDRLKGWTKELTWEKFNEKVDLLIETFYKLTAKDPDTKEYRHLTDLLEDEALFQEIKQFNDDLSDNEPRISVPVAGIGELNSASKDASRETINVCLRGITKLQGKITALIAKYEKTAKTISEEKEKARQKAEQAAKQRRPGYTYPIGTGERENGYVPYQGQAPYTPYTPWSEPSAPSKKPASLEPEFKKHEEPTKPPSGGARKPEKGKEKGEAEKALDDALDKFIGALSNIEFLIEDSKNLKNFGEYMVGPDKSADATDVNADVSSIKQIQQTLETASTDLRRTAKVRLPHVDANTKNEFIAKLTDAISKDKDYESLRKFMSDIDSIDKSRGRISNKKQYAFFDNQTRQALMENQAKQQAARQKPATSAEAAAQPATTAAQPQPKNEYEGLEQASIFALRDRFNGLKQAIVDFKTIKQKIGAKKQASDGRSGQSQRKTEVAD